MNTHDKYELPPLRCKRAGEHYSSTIVVTLEDAEDAIRAAIQADRKQRYKPALNQEWMFDEAPQPAEPVKVPGDADLLAALRHAQIALEPYAKDGKLVPGMVLNEIRAVLTSHGQPAQPAASAEPWKECRHCGWECRPNKHEAGWKPLATPVTQPAASAKPVTMKEICPQCDHQFECFHNPYINKLREASVLSPDVAETLRMCVGPLNLGLALVQMHPGADESGEAGQQCIDAIRRVNATLSAPVAAQPSVPDGGLLLDKDDVSFIAARLRRLCSRFNYPVDRRGDVFLVGVSGSIIGSILTNLELADSAAPAADGQESMTALKTAEAFNAGIPVTEQEDEEWKRLEDRK